VKLCIAAFFCGGCGLECQRHYESRRNSPFTGIRAEPLRGRGLRGGWNIDNLDPTNPPATGHKNHSAGRTSPRGQALQTASKPVGPARARSLRFNQCGARPVMRPKGARLAVGGDLGGAWSRPRGLRDSRSRPGTRKEPPLELNREKKTRRAKRLIGPYAAGDHVRVIYTP